MTDTRFEEGLAAIVASPSTLGSLDVRRRDQLRGRLAEPLDLDRRRQEQFDERLRALGRAPGAPSMDVDPNLAAMFSDALLQGLNRRAPQPSKGLLGTLADVGEFVIDTIDTPRAMVTSTVKEIGDIFDDSEGTEFSITELFDQGTGLVGNDAIGFGEVVQEFAPGLGEIEMFGVKPLDNIAGFLGEVALDPFTWMTLGTMPLARQGTMGLVRAANQLGDVSMARRLFWGGIGAVDAADIARLADNAAAAGFKGFEGGSAAIRGGVHFRIPGTGSIAKLVTNGRVKPRTIQLLSQDSRLLRVLPRAQVNRAAQAFRRRNFSKFIGGDRSALKTIIRSADATDSEWLMAFDAIDVDNVARGLEGSFIEPLERKIAALQRRISEAGFSGEDAYHAMGSDVVPDGWDEALWRELKDLGEQIRTDANDAARYLTTDDDFVPFRANWQPSVPTAEWARYNHALMSNTEANHLAMSGFEKKAGIEAGGNFMGHDLLSASDHAAARGADAVDAAIDTPRAQARRILLEEQEQWGEGVLDWFETDLWAALPQQLRTVGRRVRGRYVEMGMRHRGHAVDAFVTVDDELAKRAEAAWQAGKRQSDAQVRRVAKAQARATAAAEAAVEGDEAVAAAAKAERAAMRGRVAARTGVDLPDPSSEAAGLRQVADELNEMADEARGVLDDFGRASTRDLDALNAAAETASRHADQLGADLVRARGGLAKLVARQNELYAQAADAAADLDVPVHEAAERLSKRIAIEEEIAELEDWIALAEADVALMAAPKAQLDEAIAAANQNIARSSRPLRQLEELQELLERQRIFDDRDVNMRGDHNREIRVLAGELDVPPTLQDVRNMRMSLQAFRDAEVRKVVALKGEATDAFSVAQSKVDDLEAFRDELLAEIDALGTTDPALARELGLVLRRLEVADTGYLTYGDQDVWFHGINEHHDVLDLGVEADQVSDVVRTTGEWDTRVGLHVAQNDGYAADYATSQGAQVPDKVIGVRVRAENPAVFGADPAKFAAGRRAGSQGNARRGAGLREVHLSMFDSAVNHQVIDVPAAMRLEGRDDMAEMFEELIAAGETPQAALRSIADSQADDSFGFLLTEAAIDEDTAAVLRAMDDDGSIVSQLEELYDFSPPDEFDEAVQELLEQADAAGIEGVGVSMSDIDFFDQYVYGWTGDPIASGLDGEVGNAVARAWKRDMRAQGYDSVVYSLRADGGAWAAIPLDNAQLDVAARASASDVSTGLADDVVNPTSEAGLENARAAADIVGASIETLTHPEMAAAVRAATGTDVGVLADRTVRAMDSSVATVRRLTVPGEDVAATVRTMRSDRGTLAQAIGRWRKVAAGIDPAQRGAVDDLIEALRLQIAASDELFGSVNRALDAGKTLRAQVTAASSGRLVRTIETHIEAARLQRYAAVQELYDQAGDMAVHIDGMKGKVDDVAIKARRSRARADELRARARQSDLDIESRQAELEAVELGYRLNADEMVRAAERYEAAAVEDAAEAYAAARGAHYQAWRDSRKSIAESLRLQAEADMAAADLVRVRGEAKDVEDAWRALDRPSQVTAVEAVVKDGWSRVGSNSMLPDEIIAGLRDVNKIVGHRSTSKTLQKIDAITELFKSWAIATPGFHMRNTFGGLFNNALAGVELQTYRDFHGLYKPMKQAIDDGLGFEAQVAALRSSKKAQRLIAQGRGDVVDNFAELIRGGVFGGGQSTELARAQRVAETGFRSQHFNPLNPNNAFTNFARRPATHIENMLRGTLAMDRLAKGQGLHQAVADVYKFHFDYDDLSGFERGVLRRAIPFYTWTRKNLPLQLEMMVTNPKVYNRVGSIKREIERESEQDDLVPSFYADRFHIRLPFGAGLLGGGDGDVAYIVPDLPFTELDRALDVRQIVASSNPLIKAPLERLTNYSFFFNDAYVDAYKPVPDVWSVALTPFVPFLEAGGHVQRRDDGRLMALPRDLAALESFLPMFSQARRLVPDGDDEKSRDRWLQNVVNYLGGPGARLNTDATRESELTRREFEQRDQARLDSSLVAG